MAKDPEGDLRLESNREVMAKIWVAIPKEPGAPQELVRYTMNDIKYLYEYGFVEFRQYSATDWEKAFDEFKQPDGTFLFNKQQFVNLGRYKYTGHIKSPLDPLKIREGWYEIEAWRTFLIRNVLPSTTGLTPEFMKDGEKRAKEQGLIVNGRIKIGKEVKLWLKQLLDNYPTPLRRRELDVQAAYEKMMARAAARSTTPTLQKSVFEAGRKVGDAKKKDLDEVLVKRSKVGPQASTADTLSLKDLRKKGTARPRKTTL